MKDKFVNLVIKCKREEIFQIKEILLKKASAYIVELDGKRIQTGNDYLVEIQNKFKFPTSCNANWDGYLDWIRDLSWLEKDEYILIIYDFSKFLKNDLALKNRIILRFKDTILPFWQEEVETVVVEGKSKQFMVYLVE